ncbi:hypothetical protein CDAR_9781 [Caerostris darwini]|uniref:Uncharacterized protein n=1 Tax=Caerostris darwini TaxID=1538125 RepID=A0AAV4USK0_9ARAC|nr:hypothetical protein CDAR_9781 [Caerostris darwini]
MNPRAWISTTSGKKKKERIPVAQATGLSPEGEGMYVEEPGKGCSEEKTLASCAVRIEAERKRLITEITLCPKKDVKPLQEAGAR